MQNSFAEWKYENCPDGGLVPINKHLSQKGQEVGSYWESHYATHVYHINECTVEIVSPVNSSRSIGLGSLGRVTSEYKHKGPNDVDIRVFGSKEKRSKVLEEILNLAVKRKAKGPDAVTRNHST